jgi:hypothetical protein
MEIRRIAQLKSGDQVVGSRTRVKVVKNKMAPPFLEAEFDMTFGRGVSRVGELVDLGEELGVLVKAGSWYSRADTGTCRRVPQSIEVPILVAARWDDLCLTSPGAPCCLCVRVGWDAL